MNPAQLLNPKAFAKQQAKKRTPNYGPQQSRKPKPKAEDEVKVNIPTYDPKALLAPKSASKPSATESAPDKMAEEAENTNGLGNLYERHHNVKNREASTVVKRKVEPEDEDDAERKKQKTTFDISGGGIISEHLKKEREAAAKNGPIPDTVDLTNDDDEVVMIKEVKATEVCIGVIPCKANCTMVPKVKPPAGILKEHLKNIWPPVRINIDRQRGQHSIIYVVDHLKQPFGRIEPKTALAVTKLLDGSIQSGLRIKAWLKQRPKTAGQKEGDHISAQYDVQLVCFSSRERADMLGKWLSQKNIWLEAPTPLHLQEKGRQIEYYNPQRQAKDYVPANKSGPGSAANNQMSSTIRTTEEKKAAVNDLFARFTENDNIPDMEADDSIIKANLLPHQKKALSFMVEHEDESTVSEKYFTWKLETKPNRKEVWRNAITGLESIQKPEPTLGGILADMMGLGKTLSILSLIAATKSQASSFMRTSAIPEEIAELDGINSKATLIVCPTSVLSNWQEQMVQHIHKGALKTLIYHGSTRTQDPSELTKYNIVVTSYGTLAAESKANRPSRQVLRKINWFRIVLDEAHQIRNINTSGSMAACALAAQRRWAVTGTPVQNRLDDLGALIRFLRVKPFDELLNWNQYIISPFKQANQQVLSDLRLLVDGLTLRRSKSTIGLPPRSEKIATLEFTEEERKVFDFFQNKTQVKLQSILRDGAKLRGSTYIHVLKALLRLRQLCCHGKEMLSEEDSKSLAGIDEEHAIDLGDEPGIEGGPEQEFTTDREAYEMLEMLHSTDGDRCIVCAERILVEESDAPSAELDDMDDSDSDVSQTADLLGYFTSCYHPLHGKCKASHLENVEHTLRVDNYHDCPECGAYMRNQYFKLTKSGLEAHREEKIKRTRVHKRANLNPETYMPHTKVRALVEELHKSAAETAALPKGEPPIRSVVFTEWTSYLDLIEVGLEREAFNYVRLDGSMSVKARTDVLLKFRTDPKITVLLVSIRAGGQGLNFTAANKVYVMEPQWNPGVEAQAMDRVHRLGQKRPVEIIHFIMERSVEQGILKLQDKKNKLAALSMEKKITHDEEAAERIKELKELFK